MRAAAICAAAVLLAARFSCIGAVSAPAVAPSLLPLANGSAAISSKPPFWWGTATAAYQIEGAISAGGKGPSIWDVFVHEPGKIHDGQTGDVTDDFYDKYPGDIKLMQELGMRHLRFSISWTRIFPNGTGAVNAAGVRYYSDLIDALLAAGVQPYVTLYHWDLPQALQAAYGGFNDSRIVADFEAYAAAVFKALGNRVMYWTTFNEPQTFCFNGYGVNGLHAPGTNSSVAAWNCVYHVLLCHAAAARQFRALLPGAKLSMNLNAEWGQPWAPDDPRDVAAADAKMLFFTGIYADPLYFGKWPAVVEAHVPYLPKFTPEQAASLQGTMDYWGLNFYTAKYVQHTDDNGGYRETVYGPNGLIGPQAQSWWEYIVPWAFRSMLNWINNRYHPGEIIVTENGVDVPGEDAMPLAQALNDTFRIDFLRDYIQQATLAVEVDKVPMTGYMVWALLDNFEWAEGYQSRFGLIYVDYKDNQKRYIKKSARFLAELFGTAPATSTR